MKFLCDRCKTRYSIGDDRVRGKILKIRCKNCANVITVREGLGEPDEVSARAGRPTTGAPPIASSAPANALGAAFAQQMTTKPPPALEEEWYVSIDGDQSGPFSLAEAQRWIAAKPHDADLHCWSEGFDDWLPVDKISHFRGLRKRPQAPSAPPPMPRSAPGPARNARGPAAAVQEPEDEPKPLFAATMAALERGVAEKSAASQRANGSGSVSALPSATAPAIPKAMPNNAVQAKSGSGAVPSIPKPGSGPTPAIPSLTAKAGTASTKMSGTGPQSAARTTPGMSAGAKALAEAFDLNPNDSATAVEAQPFADEIGTAPASAAAKRADEIDAAITQPKSPSLFAPVEAAPLPSDDDMEIGEVSRVVKLADLAKMSTPKKPAVKTGRTTASVPKIPIGELGLSSTPAGGMGALAAPMGAMGPVPSESIVAAAPLAVHRRGMMILLGAAALLLAGGVVAVVLLVQNNDDETSTLNHAQQYDTSRPDELQRPRNAIEAVQQTAALATPKQQPIKRPTNQIHVQQPEIPETPGDLTKAKIKPEEIEDIANKNAEGTKRCYLRAQKGALGIDIQDLKRIDVSFNIDPMGSVTGVTLSDHTNDQFGQCLIGRIKSWKFRASPGGQFRLPLVFGS